MAKKRFERIVDKINSVIDADDYIINYSKTENALTRIADNMITQNVDRVKESLSLTVYKGKKKASLSTSNLNDESIESFVKKCENVAELSMEDKEYLPSLSEDSQKIDTSIDEEILKFDEKARSEIAKGVIQKAENAKVTIAGAVSKSIDSLGVATKNGVFKFYQNGRAEYSNTIDMSGEKGNAFSNGFFLRELTPEQNFEEALNDAKMLQNRIEMEPGRYKIVLSARAATKLFVWLGFAGLDRRAVDEGYSPYSGKLGNSLFSEKINIYTDPYYNKMPSIPFSTEGLPYDRRYIAKNGVLTDVPCTRFWADKNGLVPWGVSNLIIDGGEKSEEELIKSVDRGFYIKDLWYIRLVKMEELLLTGMTRNGFFYIEDGKIKNGSTHFRWNDSPIRMLKDIIELGRSFNHVNNYIPVSVPSMLIDNFYLSSKTLF